MRVTIVGAGIIGHAIAYELASRGAIVRVLDMRGPGAGATRASAGMLAPYIEGHHEALLRLCLASLSLYDGFIHRVTADSARPVEYQRTGTLQVARTAEDSADLTAASARLSATGVPHTLLDAASARRLEPALTGSLTSALLIPQHGYVGVATLVSALGAAAGRRGVSQTTARVEGIDTTSDGLRVRTSAGNIDSDIVVVTTGSWVGDLPPLHGTAAPVRPVRGQLLHLRFPTPPLSRVIWGTGCYLVPWRDGSLLVGATVEDVGFDESVTVAGVRHLLQEGIELLPSIGGAVFHEARTGLRPFTADQLPLIGPSSTMRGVWYATGHYRNGILLAPLTARLLADCLIDGREAPELAMVCPARFGV